MKRIIEKIDKLSNEKLIDKEKIDDAEMLLAILDEINSRYAVISDKKIIRPTTPLPQCSSERNTDQGEDKEEYRIVSCISYWRNFVI